MDIKRPAKDSVLKIIEDIRKLDLKSVSIDQINLELEKLKPGYAMNSVVYHPGFKIFRGVRFNKDLPKEVHEISYPPAENIIKYQRANRPAQSLFYGATAKTVPFYELDMEPGERMILSKWVTTRKLLLNNLGYVDTAFKNLDSNRECPKFGPVLLQVNDPANKLIHDFFSEEFTKKVNKGDEDSYKITIAIAEKNLGKIGQSHPELEKEEIHEFQGLIYPTVAMKANADNVAIFPKYVDQRMKLVRVECVEVLGRSGTDFEARPVDLADRFDDGKIHWKGHVGKWTLKQDQQYERKLNADLEWEIIDNEGKIVPPDPD